MPPDPSTRSSADRARGAAGLTTTEADELLREIGPNLPPGRRRRGVVSRAGDQLRDPMILLLQGAAVLSAALRDWSSTVIIAFVVVFNTTVGVLQQSRADRVMAELTRLAAPTARVQRDGVLVEVPAGNLVPGDLVALTGGDLVPADAVVLEAHDLDVDEAPVTGESLAVRRGPGDPLLAGTRVTRGRALVRVTRTGADSSLGRIATLLLEAQQRPTPLQRRLSRLSRGLVVLVVTLTVVVVVLGVLQGRTWGEMVLVGLSLTVAAVPESLPAVVTIALAVGAHRMARRHVVVRSLPAVETLGSVTVVATDKTGTLTEGRMVVRVLWVDGELLDVTGSDVQAREGPGSPDRRPAPDHPAVARVLRDVTLCNDAAVVADEGGGPGVTEDPLDAALLVLVSRGRVDPEVVRSAWPRIGESPFETSARAMTTEHRSAEGRMLRVCKGAPEAVLDLAADGGADLTAARAMVETLAGDGLRVIAVADSVDGTAWRLAGLVGVGDPPRPTARGVVQELRRAGIRLVLVTGDHARTAASVALQVGISEPGVEPVEGRHLEDVPAEHRKDLTVVARVLPEQKVHVVQWLQEAGEVVAMLGDGVNDAPALRSADIGVAAGLRGSEVAKEAADLVLTDDELGSVVAAVEEGRRILTNIRAFLLFAVSGGLSEVGVMVAGSLVGLTVPLLPGQILWINLLTHGLVGVAFGSQPLDPDEMARPPRPPSESILTRSATARLCLVGIALVAAALSVAALIDGPDDVRRTAVLLTLGAGQLGVALAVRAVRKGSARGRPTGWRRVTGAASGIELSVLLAAGLLAAAVWLPALQGLLHTRSLPLTTTLVALTAGALPGVLLRGWVRETARRAARGQR